MCRAAWADGHEVQVAYDGDEALACNHAFRPRVALLDVGTPGQSGTEVAALIRQQPRHGPVTLVAITGFGQHRDRQAALASGFDHLTKPIEIDQLESLIAALPADQPAPRDSARKAS